MKDEIKFLKRVAEVAPELACERAMELKKTARHQADRAALNEICLINIPVSVNDLHESVVVDDEPVFSDDDAMVVDGVSGSYEI